MTKKSTATVMIKTILANVFGRVPLIGLRMTAVNPMRQEMSENAGTQE